MARQTSRRRSAPRYIATRGPSFLPFKSPSERGTNSEGMTWDEWRTAAGTGGLTTKKLLDAWQASEDPAEHRPARLRSNRRGSRRLVSLFRNSRRRTSLRRNSGVSAANIKKALAQVHLAEKTSSNRNGIPRWKAVKHAISDFKLNRDEADILLRATHVARSEIEPNSRRRTSLRPNSYTFTPAGKKVVMAFLDRRAADSTKLKTDGKRLDGLWMGGRGIAEWVGDKIVFGELGSRSSQTIQNLIRREAPANWLKPNRRRSMRRNSSLVKKGADASAIALMERAEHAAAAGDSGVAAAAFEHLDRWKERHGKWPFEASRYWRAVNRMQALSRNGRRRRSSRVRRNSSFGPARDQAASRVRNAFARGDKAAANRALAELRAIDIGLMPRAVRKNGRRMRRNPPIEFDAETRALAQRVYGKK